MRRRKTSFLFWIYLVHIVCMGSCRSAGLISSNNNTALSANTQLQPNAQLLHSAKWPDVEAFWASTKERLAVIPMEPKVVPVAEPLPYRKYKVTLNSLGGIRICAWLSVPVQGEVVQSKPWPVIITTPGYSGTQQGVMLSECQRGYAILQVYPRGQGESSEYYKIERDKLTGHLDNPNGAYYQGAYANVIRMIDFVKSRNDLDGNRIALVGTSQGGGISLAVAALDSRIKVVVAHVPFLCNFRVASQTPSLVKNLLDGVAGNNETSWNTLDYFDPFLLTRNLRIPVIMSAGGKDDVCPIATIQSVYNNLHGKKKLKIYPELKHTSCLDFYNISWSWLDKYFRKKAN